MLNSNKLTVDLFILYVLFSHFRPRDVTPGSFLSLGHDVV